MISFILTNCLDSMESHGLVGLLLESKITKTREFMRVILRGGEEGEGLQF
jgi:hypothetical protein